MATLTNEELQEIITRFIEYKDYKIIYILAKHMTNPQVTKLAIKALEDKELEFYENLTDFITDYNELVGYLYMNKDKYAEELQEVIDFCVKQ